MRTTSHPASASARIWARFAATSSAGALSIDCTTTGAPPPSGTSPTITRRVRSFGLASIAIVSPFLIPADRERDAAEPRPAPKGTGRTSALQVILPLIDRSAKQMHRDFAERVLYAPKPTPDMILCMS